MIALIMAGGSGTRFWPLSRQNYPKQFLKVTADRSMLQLTVDRLLPLISMQDIYIVTASNQVQLVKEHLPELPSKNIIIEPFGMNTAPCIALSIEYLKQFYPQSTNMIVLPADHTINNTDAFLSSLNIADVAAHEDRLITFGIVPEYPATGYGYIEAGASIHTGLQEVNRFKEKPDRATAEQFLHQGNFLWNSGMFCWSIKAIEAAFTEYQPQIAKLCSLIGQTWKLEGYSADISELYRQMPRIPIDIGIMEKADKRGVIPVDIGWNDVGSWKALADISIVNAEGNSSISPICAIDSQNNYINTNKYTAIIGVDNLCIIETPDAILITTKDRTEDVKLVVERLKADERIDLL